MIATKKLVNARELHEFLKVGRDFTTWIKDRINKYGFVEGMDYIVTFTKTGERSNVVKHEYILKMDMAKELAMVENNSRGRAVRRYFIEIEKKYRQQAIDVSRLSPELKMFKQIFDSVAKTQLEQQKLKDEITSVKGQLAATSDVIQNVKDTIVQRDENWRDWVKQQFNKIAGSSSEKHREYKSLSYRILEERGRCNLAVRLKNLKNRLYEKGATKTKINRVNRLDVIERDPRLKEIYTTIIKELVIKYAA
jgi:anti-repressor protein